VKFACIEAERAAFPVTLMCVLLGVARSGFYAWRQRAPSPRSIEDQRLGVEIAEAHQRSRQRYGSPRVHAELCQNGRHVGRKRVARLMRLQGLFARPKRKWRRTTMSDHSKVVAPNLLNRRFTADAANTAWVSDITYIWTREGWLYLVAILDLFSRRVVGWATSPRIDAELCVGALRAALQARHPSPGLIFHSDRGVQFAADAFRAVLIDHEAILSMSRRGNCWDNAPAESFWSTIKAELVEESDYETREAAHVSVFEYIEGFYNSRRKHSRLQYKSPIEFEALARAATTTA
jgi:transposase InsO family protein